MSDELRDEAAALARSLRRQLERERAAGTGDLVARGGVRAKAGRAPAATAPAPMRREAVASAPAPRIASAPAPASASAPRVASAPAPILATTAVAAVAEVDLFGTPIPRPVARVVEPVIEVAPEDVPLNPGGWEARAALAAAAEPVLAQIAAEVRSCEKCALWETRAKAVPGVGSAKSGIVFIGEAPGADEDRLGEPFVGRAGKLLDQIIQAMDDKKLIPGVSLTRATVFIGNIIHCRPPANRVPLPFEIEQSSPYLRRQLEALKPRVICCLGKTAAEFLLGSKGSLASMRGKVYRYEGARMIVTYHPAACLRNPDYKRPVWEDMQFLARQYLSD